MSEVPAAGGEGADGGGRGALRSLWSGATGLLRAALRAFLLAVVAVLAAGAVLAGLSYYLLRDHPGFALLAAAAALAESAAAGVALGTRQAAAAGLTHGLQALGLGRAVVRLVFDRVLGVGDEPAAGGGNWVARQAGRLPLAQAEERLRGAVSGLLAAEGGRGGWLRRRLQAGLLRRVEGLTLARFRTEGEGAGGVDLLKVRGELEARADDLLLGKLRAALRLTTLLVALGLPALVLAQTYLLRSLLEK